MARYLVNHRYAAERGGADMTAFGPWVEGAEVDIDEADAEWVNADSPETLTAVASKPHAKKSAAKHHAKTVGKPIPAPKGG